MDLDSDIEDSARDSVSDVKDSDSTGRGLRLGLRMSGTQTWSESELGWTWLDSDWYFYLKASKTLHFLWKMGDDAEDHEMDLYFYLFIYFFYIILRLILSLPIKLCRAGECVRADW